MKVFIELEFEVQVLGRVVIESPLNDRHADGPKKQPQTYFCTNFVS
ncbi:hypothetical protein CTRC69_04350 [Chlamydia trachomatis RC-F/69]|nr:hypothetical protein [Chlamydia trachomatis]AGR95192.1 hypothetical protein CTRC46_04335 [Chlamydia trachomatis RC-L2(s)/46]AGR97071.1 hypothetical protein CTRC943_04320 [Chlamydia trachomatis RC-J/943]AGR97991.1 hypothetical protein CTRC953_04305 [Chlamydia trachomatis RC-J/953]AGS01723.1 hypothetical protein CTRC966_04330 [Chlamydia trachomatis RC-J/966]AGS03604.1 hypothetical protein CTRC971_04330 [Chlamydia trachomatis RC-J/971]AGS04532.1 hypothetical protein CTRC55_04330 [Chlamydia tr